jgi:transposase-like protein
MTTFKTERSIARGAAQWRIRPNHSAGFVDAKKDFLREFPTEDACLTFITEIRWPNGVTRCGKCRLERKHHRVTGRKAYACDRCGNHVYPLRGTVFARSSTSLQKWFYAICLMASANRRVTAKRLQRETGVTYKTAWRMLRQLRVALAACEPRPAQFIAGTIAASNPRNVRAQDEPAAPCGNRQPLEAQNVTCLEGIIFIFNFFPAYLRMCRDV